MVVSASSSPGLYQLAGRPLKIMNLSSVNHSLMKVWVELIGHNLSELALVDTGSNRSIIAGGIVANLPMEFTTTESLKIRGMGETEGVNTEGTVYLLLGLGGIPLLAHPFVVVFKSSCLLP